MESLEDAEQEENAEDTHQSFNICCIINKMGKKEKKKLLYPQSTTAGMVWFL
jgi:hypothetical protein